MWAVTQISLRNERWCKDALNTSVSPYLTFSGCNRPAKGAQEKQKQSTVWDSKGCIRKSEGSQHNPSGCRASVHVVWYPVPVLGVKLLSFQVWMARNTPHLGESPQNHRLTLKSHRPDVKRRSGLFPALVSHSAAARMPAQGSPTPQPLMGWARCSCWEHAAGAKREPHIQWDLTHPTKLCRQRKRLGPPSQRQPQLCPAPAHWGHVGFSVWIISQQAGRDPAAQASSHLHEHSTGLPCTFTLRMGPGCVHRDILHLSPPGLGCFCLRRYPKVRRSWKTLHWQRWRSCGCRAFRYAPSKPTGMVWTR